MGYFLSIIASFKNEEQIIKEWIDHNMWQGVEHFYLIDNGSDDDYLEVIQPYIDNGLITLYVLPERLKQVEHFNYVFNIHKEETEWILFVDIDEYWYGIKQTLKEYLMINNEKIDMLKCYWNTFGSNGYDKQPSNIRLSFTKKLNNIDTIKSIINKNENCDEKNHGYSKYLVKSSKLIKAFIHKCRMVENAVEKVETDEIRINHYQTMSLEYFTKNKLNKVGGKSITYENIRTLEYFNERNINQIDDYTLSNLLNNGYKK